MSPAGFHVSLVCILQSFLVPEAVLHVHGRPCRHQLAAGKHQRVLLTHHSQLGHFSVSPIRSHQLWGESEGLGLSSQALRFLKSLGTRLNDTALVDPLEYRASFADNGKSFAICLFFTTKASKSGETDNYSHCVIADLCHPCACIIDNGCEPRMEN